MVIEGLSLFTTLRSARAQIANGQRSHEEISLLVQMNAHQLQLDRLSCVNDVQIGALTKPAEFDQYMGAFFVGGRNVNF